MKKIAALFLSLSLLSSLVCGIATAADPVLITVAHGATEEHSSHAGWLKFKEIVERDSKGALAVEIFPNQQMGGDREVFEAAQLGNVWAGHSSASPVAGFAKEFYVLDAPFLFSSRDDVYAKLDGAPGKLLLNALERVNLKGLGFSENGFRNLTANKKVLTPDDLRGIKIRVMENKIQMLTWSSLGANPTPIAFGELFTALQQKTVDAQENPFELIFTNKFYEVQKNVMTTNHIYSPLVVFMNLEYFNGLEPEQQEIVLKAARESIAYQRDISKTNEKKAIDAIAGSGSSEIVQLSPEQRKAFQDKMGPVYDEVRKQVGNEDVMKQFLGK